MYIYIYIIYIYNIYICIYIYICQIVGNGNTGKVTQFLF